MTIRLCLIEDNFEVRNGTGSDRFYRVRFSTLKWGGQTITNTLIGPDAGLPV